jgi:hypothetical protein
VIRRSAPGIDAPLDEEVQAVALVPERAAQLGEQPDDPLLRRIALHGGK